MPGGLSALAVHQKAVQLVLILICHHQDGEQDRLAGKSFEPDVHLEIAALSGYELLARTTLEHFQILASQGTGIFSLDTKLLDDVAVQVDIIRRHGLR